MEMTVISGIYQPTFISVYQWLFLREGENEKKPMISKWCGRSDLNRDAFRHTPLKNMPLPNITNLAK
jgi:hypothetical protein